VGLITALVSASSGSEKLYHVSDVRALNSLHDPNGSRNCINILSAAGMYREVIVSKFRYA
jgi:hypothetical protein